MEHAELESASLPSETSPNQAQLLVNSDTVVEINDSQSMSTQGIHLHIETMNSHHVPLGGESDSNISAGGEQHSVSCFPGRESALACIGRMPSNRRNTGELSVAINIERSIIDNQHTSSLPSVEANDTKSLYELQIVRAMWPAADSLVGFEQESKITCEEKECTICLEELKCENSVVTRCHHYLCASCAQSTERFALTTSGVWLCPSCRECISFINMSTADKDCGIKVLSTRPGEEGCETVFKTINDRIELIAALLHMLDGNEWNLGDTYAQAEEGKSVMKAVDRSPHVDKMIVEIEQDRTPDLLYTQEVLRALQQLRAQSMRSRRRTRRQQRSCGCHVYVFLAVALSIGLVAAIIKLAASRLN
uniref:RING-type domain-containing protein n=1 Tax=Hanusia phi TaxID=3032 RepID=A0A7S0NE76_9CRYP|mmetsp:Transcript_8003/g.18258  ORF Transcript_8003/g.18258 Transcript_8003/m.18258 type:complete len:364 (+) Transcript_8003:94-1185(+)